MWINLRFALSIDSGQKMARTEGAKALSDTERREILIDVARGKTVPEIAEAMNRSPKTIWKILAKWRAEGGPRQAVLALAYQMGQGDDREA